MLQAAELPNDGASDAAQEAAQDAYYHLTQADVDSLFEMLSGMVTVEIFTLLSLLLILGVLLVVVFVTTMRRV